MRAQGGGVPARPAGRAGGALSARRRRTASPAPTRRRAARQREVVWLDGHLLPARRARVPALDRGLLYGDGLFETLRVYHGRPFALEEHLARLARSARALGLPLPPPSIWRSAIERVLAACGLARADAAVRLTVTRGAGGEGPVPPPRPRPTLLVQARPLDPQLVRRQARGVNVCLVPPSLGRALAAHKTLSYLPGVLARRLASRAGCEEALHVSARGQVLEGAGSSVFAVIDGKLLTPPLSAGILPGVTRSLLIGLARHAGLPVAERALPLSRLAAAREVFLTSSLIEVVPVVRLDGRKVGGGRPGPVTRQLQAAYRAHVALTLALPRAGPLERYPTQRRRARA